MCMRATRAGSNGRCWRPRSRATSSPTSRFATNRSTAPTRATTLTEIVPARRPAQGQGHRSPRPLQERRRWRKSLARSASAPRQRLGRSLAIREVDAGSCNGCELEIHALNNPVYDVERFGLKFVASPRHADVLLVTGPVTWNMREALLRTYNAAPEPKWVVALGDCATNCGVFAGSPAVVGPLAEILPVDLHVPGCPPAPLDDREGSAGPDGDAGLAGTVPARPIACV